MFTYRLRGLLNLFVLVTTGLVAGLFLAFAALSRHLPWFQLSPDVNLTLCLLLIIGAMIGSGRYLTQISWRFHEIGWPDAARLATQQVFTVALVLFTLIVATKDRSISRLFLAYFLLLTWLMLLFVNRRLPRYLARLAFSHLNRLPTLFMGQARNLDRLSSWIAQKEHLGMTSVGFLSDDYVGEEDESIGRFWGTSSELKRVIEDLKVAQVMLLDLPAKEEVRSILSTCQGAGCRLLIYDNLAERLPVPMIPVIEEGRFFYTMQTEPLEDPLNRMIKRAFDIAVSLPVVVFILPPLCAWVWIMQRFQAPGSLFFIRPRGGRRRSEFRMVKFRSMYENRQGNSAGEAVQAKRDDERIYSFGRFMRKASIDEFPQFWNVLMNDMSIVGPRPHLPKHDDEFSQIAMLYRTRQLVKPGITGLAQIRGFRGEITDPRMLERRVELDVVYITGWSIWLDLQIVLKTALQILSPPKAAY